MSSIKRKYNKLKVAKQNDMLIPLLQGRLVKLEHDIKIRFMKKVLPNMLRISLMKR